MEFHVVGLEECRLLRLLYHLLSNICKGWGGNGGQISLRSLRQFTERTMGSDLVVDLPKLLGEDSHTALRLCSNAWYPNCFRLHATPGTSLTTILIRELAPTFSPNVPRDTTAQSLMGMAVSMLLAAVFTLRRGYERGG